MKATDEVKNNQSTAERLKKLQSDVNFAVKDFFKNFFVTDGKERISGYELFWIFMICNVLGYCVEMVYGYVTNGYWESRQSLVIGPFGLAYGIGGVLMTVMLYKDNDKKWYQIFFKTFIIGTVAEYIMSLGSEIVFGSVAWDYTALPLDIDGRVCLLYSGYWGILGLVWLKFIYPLLLKVIHSISIKPGKVLFWIAFVFIVSDMVLSCAAVFRYEERKEALPPANHAEEVLDEYFDDAYIKRVYANWS